KVTGCTLAEAYGLTETSPITHFNRPWSIKPGTVGHAIRGTETRIADDGELLIRGPQVMAGYYKNEAATREVFTDDGFFRTGDIGLIDEDGCLKITGRIKDIIVTAGGKNISPQNIENSIKDSRFIEQVAIIGDRRKFLSALVVPSFPDMEAWAAQQGISFNTTTDLLTNAKVLELYRSEIDERTAQFARVEQIRKFTLIKAEWTQLTGELTPTQKIKRRVIEKKYAAEIDAMYADETGD
ncbi:MAG TPA: AMP-binding protein, partial [Spirochaetota bacterium]|nr:AMP-binding protein [Spirochaetota bacterium]